jgi:hypothetical protein
VVNLHLIVVVDGSPVRAVFADTLAARGLSRQPAAAAGPADDGKDKAAAERAARERLRAGLRLRRKGACQHDRMPAF